MTGRIERLEWDTEFFGVAIGRADLSGATPEVLATIDEEARDLGLECLYGSVDPKQVDALAEVVASPWRLVEVGLMLDRDPSLPFSAPADSGTGRMGTPDDLPQLEETIDRLAPWSRYAMDPRFGRGEAARLLQAWVRRAADPDPSTDRWKLLVVEDDTGVTSFITLDYGPGPRIDLLGSRASGTGSAQALMAFTLEVTAGQHLDGGPVAARNVQSLRYSEQAGFRINASLYNFHRWLDEGGGGPPR